MLIQSSWTAVTTGVSARNKCDDNCSDIRRNLELQNFVDLD
jgi:hypothetical protein